MVSTSSKPNKPGSEIHLSSTPSVVILLVKVLFVLLILLLLPKFVIGGGGRRATDVVKQIRTMREHCQQTLCARWIPEESMNCLNSCTSPGCYEAIYGHTEPLEEGEIDIPRARAFEECLKNELRVRNKRLLEERYGARF